MPGLFPTPLDYSDRDYASALVRLRDLARSVFPGWTDFSRANFGNFLINGFAWVLDNLSFYLDAYAREAFIPTATRRVSLIRHGRLVGFTLPGASAATGTLRFTIPATDVNPRTIASGTRVRAIAGGADPIQFRTTAAGTILVGQTFIDVAAEQSVSVSENFTSDETPSFEVLLGRTPYLDNSATVSAAEGAFTQVATFLGTTSSSLVYVILVDENDRARIRFGDGTTGRIPTGTVTVGYRVGGGTQGNVDAGQVRVLESAIADGFGTVPASVTNPAPFSGGAERMTVTRARQLMADQVRSVTRSVSKADFEANTALVPGVARALMATRNEDAAIAENTGRIVVVALGSKTVSGRTRPATPSAPLLASVTTMLTVTRPHTLTFQVTAQAATFLDVDVTARVALEPGAAISTTGTAVLEALRDLFAVLLADGTPNPDIDFGANLAEADGTITGELSWSTVFNAVRDVSGVRKVDEAALGFLLNGLQRSIFLGPREFPRLRTILVTDLDTGGTILSTTEPSS